jgi:hypothetical protein
MTANLPAHRDDRETPATRQARIIPFPNQADPLGNILDLGTEIQDINNRHTKELVAAVLRILGQECPIPGCGARLTADRGRVAAHMGQHRLRDQWTARMRGWKW